MDALTEVVKALEAADRLTDAIVDALKEIRAEQAELRDEVHALSNRIENVTHRVNMHKEYIEKLDREGAL